ncbi:MAG: Gfo/Idh/MocA family oxidoreductase [Oscillospiraceae bacterium]|nr:Gfo/Idh/MocA family oxidoreductase [Oscillospiraceae bacterium]
MNRSIRVGIVGAGAISDIYLKNMTTRFPHLKVVSICANHLEHAQKKADQYGILACSLEEMLADPGVDMIVNLTPTHAHYSIIRNALLAGKHVYTEKTMTDSPVTAAELVALAKERGLYLASAPDTFLGAAWQTARKFIDDGELGTVTSFAICSNRDATVMGSINKFRREPGGGACYNYVVYAITALVSLLGPVSEVAAMVETPYPTRTNLLPQSPEFGQTISTPNESQVYALLRMACGICGTYHLNEESALFDQPYFAIYGTKGILYLPDPNGFGGSLRFYPNNFDMTMSVKPQEIPLTFPYSDNARGLGPADLAQAIQTGSESRVNAAQACHVIEVLTAMMDSGKSRQFLPIHSTCDRPEPMKEERL